MALLVATASLGIAGLAHSPRVSSLRSSSRAARITATAPVEAPPFEDWAYARGILAPKLFISDTDLLRGVLAVESIAAGEEICVVPRPCTLDLASAEGAGAQAVAEK